MTERQSIIARFEVVAAKSDATSCQVSFWRKAPTCREGEIVWQVTRRSMSVKAKLPPVWRFEGHVRERREWIILHELGHVATISFADARALLDAKGKKAKDEHIWDWEVRAWRWAFENAPPHLSHTCGRLEAARGLSSYADGFRRPENIRDLVLSLDASAPVAK